MLKSRAAVEGLSLSGYVLKEIQPILERPTMQELAERIRKRSRVQFQTSPVRDFRGG